MNICNNIYSKSSNKHGKKKFILAVLAMSMFSSPYGVYAENNVYSDIGNHWAENEILKWNGYGIIQGYEGRFRPDSSITRGEMAVILDKIMKYQKSSDAPFSDLGEAFYTVPILKAYNAGVISGYAGEVRPNDKITRQEAIVMISKAFEVTPISDGSMTNFEDEANIADWAKSYVYGMAGKGFITNTGKFNPKVPITRAETIKIIDNIISDFYSESGDYTSNAENDVIINSPDIVLNDSVIKGNLIISEGVKEGEVTLNNVKVEGCLFVKGGGVNSIKINGDSQINTLSIDKKDSNVRVVSSDNSKVEITFIESNANLEGNFKEIYVSKENVKLSATDISATNINISSKSNLYLNKSQDKGKKIAINIADTGAGSIIESSSPVQITAFSSCSINLKKGAEGTVINKSNDFVAVNVSNETASPISITDSKGDKAEVKSGESINSKNTENTNMSNSSEGTRTSTSGGGSSSSSSSSSGGSSSNIYSSIKISSINVVSDGVLEVKLNKAIDKRLTKDDFDIIYTDNNRNKAISSVETSDNKTYKLKFSNYADGNYKLKITFPNKTSITKTFTYEESKTPDYSSIEISSINVVSDEVLEVKLNKAIDKKLTKDDFDITYTDNNRNMAVSSVETNDNKTYKLKISDYSDGNYRLKIILPDKTSITKTFTYKVSENPDNPDYSSMEIENVEMVSSGLLRVTLNRKTDIKLEKEAFNIICTGGGKDMTILNVSTSDNKVYDLTTAYYDDNSYNIEITFPDNTRKDKDFVYRSNCPQLKSQTIKRLSDTEAEFSYISDMPGDLYYILSENQTARSFSRASVPTEDEIISSGIKTVMKQNLNTISLKNLKKDVSYTMYYAAKGVDNTVTPVNSIKIETYSGGNQGGDETGDIQIVSASAHKKNKEVWYKIEFNKPTDKTLGLEAFSISCPKGDLTLGKVETDDNKTYNVFMKTGYSPYSNTTYTATVTLSDNSTASKTFYVDLQAPIILNSSVKRISETAAEASIKSDEAGYLYYKILDEFEGAGTTAPKDPTDIYATGTKIKMGYGENKIKLDNVKDGQYFCYATEDEYENRLNYFSDKEIPAYVPDDNQGGQENPDEIKILNAVPGGDKDGRPSVTVTLSKKINVMELDIQYTEISGLPGKGSYGSTFVDGNSFSGSIVVISIMNGVEIPEGERTINLVINDKQISFDFYYSKTSTASDFNEEPIESVPNQLDENLKASDTPSVKTDSEDSKENNLTNESSKTSDTPSVKTDSEDSKENNLTDENLKASDTPSVKTDSEDSKENNLTNENSKDNLI